MSEAQMFLSFYFHNCKHREKHWNNGKIQPHAALTIRSTCIGLINALICHEGLVLFRILLHSFEYSFKNRLKLASELSMNIVIFHQI